MSTVKNTITLTRSEAKWLADAALSGMSNDDVTPVICAAHIKVDGDTAQVTVTDRYRVHTARVKLEAKARAHTFLLPREGVLWLQKNAGYFGRSMSDFHRVAISTAVPEDGAGTVSITVTPVEASKDAMTESITWSGHLTRGTFPESLFALFETARNAEGVSSPVSLNLKFLARAKVLGDDYRTPTFKFTAGANPNKPGPLHLSWSRDGDKGREVYAEAIIQPNLMLR